MKLIIIVVCLFFMSCGVNNKTEGKIVARVGQETLTKENLLFLAGNRSGDLDFFSRTTNKWVENKLLYLAAVSVGLDKDHQLMKERDLFYENLLISSYIKIQTQEKTKTTKKEVSEYYLKNKESFRRLDDEVVVKHFVFSTKKAANKTMRELMKKKTGVDMEELLNRQQVETKTLRKKGAGSNLVDFVFSAAVGDFVGPKKHKDNFHVFQILQKHKEGSYIGLEKVYDEIYNRLYKEKEAFVLEAILDSLYLSSDVFVSQGALNQ